MYSHLETSSFSPKVVVEGWKISQQINYESLRRELIENFLPVFLRQRFFNFENKLWSRTNRLAQVSTRCASKNSDFLQEIWAVAEIFSSLLSDTMSQRSDWKTKRQVIVVYDWVEAESRCWTRGEYIENSKCWRREKATTRWSVSWAAPAAATTQTRNQLESSTEHFYDWKTKTNILLGANVPFMWFNEHWFHQLFNVCHQTRLNFIKTSSQQTIKRIIKHPWALVDSSCSHSAHFLMKLSENDVIASKSRRTHQHSSV